MNWLPRVLWTMPVLGVLLGALWGTLWGAPAWAATPYGVNLIRNGNMEGSAGKAPEDTFHGIGYDPNVGKRRLWGEEGTLQVNYRYGKTVDGRAYTEVELVNQASHAANYTLNLSTQRVNLVDGETYRLSSTVSALGPQAVSTPVMLTLGFQFYKADGSYLSDMAPTEGEYKSWLDEPQKLSAEYVAGAPESSSGRVPASFLPRLALYNFPPDASLRLRIMGVQLTAAPKPAAIQVLPLRRPVANVAPGQVLPLTVELAGVPAKGAFASRLTLVPAQGKPWRFDSAARLAFGHWGKVSDVWQLRLPSDLPLGVYALGYEVPALGVKAALGNVTVSEHAGMWVGMTLHRYPGTSEAALGPFQGRYQFARSLASIHADINQWWQGPDEYDWKKLDKWAQFHAKPGERKLLFTFSGTPTWASEAPREPSAFSIPGFAAPPTQAYRKAYQRMVRDTLARYKGRVLASECWNEPDSRDFFTGTKTDLADLCKSVYVATKQVDASIMVICPQADDPSHLDAIYSARTSAGEPITQFCDLVGAHIYNRLGQDTSGQDFARQRLSDALDTMVAMSRKYGLKQALAVTEFGLNSCVLGPSASHPTVFGRMPSEEASEAMYRTVAGFREYGVALLALYSYDHPNNNPECRPGGSFIRMTYIDKSGEQKIDPLMARRVAETVSDFGRTGDN